MKLLVIFGFAALLLPAPATAAPDPAQREQEVPGEPGSDPSASPEAQPPAADPAPAAGSIPWDDPGEKLEATARGAVDACEAVAFPLTLLPAVGTIVANVVDWLCLVPAAFAIDYVGAHHAGYGSFLWQPLAALLLAKLWRGIVLVVGITGIVIASLTYVTAVSTALALAGVPYYIPVGLTGVITVIGVMILGMRALEKGGSDLVFRTTYTVLADELESPAEASAAQEGAWVRPPPGPFGRTLALLSAAAGAEPEREWTHALPVAGPLFKATAKGDAVEAATLQVGRDVLGERPAFPDALRVTASLTSWTEGVFGAVGQALLGVGGVIFVAGTIAAAVSYEQREDALEYGLWIGGLGSAGVVVAAGGVVFILARQIPRVARALLVPAAFGLWPPFEEAE